MSRSLLLVALFALPVDAADPVEIRLTADAPPAVEVTGLSAAQTAWLKGLKPDAAAWPGILAVRVLGDDGAAAPTSVLGTHRMAGDRLRFEPRFPLVPGGRYRAVFDLPSFPDRPNVVGIALADVVADLTVPRPAAGPPTVVTHVYPTAARLPENVLRLYVQFSAPMSRGGVYRYLSLLDAAGTPVPSPFLELGEELWSADGTRFTLLFDPARVKRGLVPREEDGPTLEAGKRYTLVVSPDWPDADGRPLRAGFRKAFTAGAMDADPVDPRSWAVSPPARPGDALVVRLAKPLDRALLQRLVWVEDAAGARVPGAVSVGGGERVLSFAPATDWAPGAYRLVADPRLEDPCGNRVGEAFEVDETRPRGERPGPVTRGFAVR